MKTLIKPCPFCGHNALVTQLKQSVPARYHIVCGNASERCIASDHYVFGRFFVTKQDAIDAWNRRTPETDTPCGAWKACWNSIKAAQKGTDDENA